MINSMHRKPAVFTVVVDVDETLLPLLPAWLARYNYDFGENLTAEQVTDFDITLSVIPEARAHIHTYLHDPTLYDGIAPYEGALEGIEAIRRMGARVVFATSCNPDMAGRKMRWLQEHAFLTPPEADYCDDYVECHDKALLRGDLIIDDRIETCVAWIQRTGQPAILFPQPHNRRRWEEVAGLVGGFALPHVNTPADTWRKVPQVVEQIMSYVQRHAAIPARPTIADEQALVEDRAATRAELPAPYPDDADDADATAPAVPSLETVTPHELRKLGRMWAAEVEAWLCTIAKNPDAIELPDIPPQVVQLMLRAAILRRTAA